ncbi:MAG: hypothetical protein ACRDZO_20295 [Egibacteraceae bacterium]
MSEDVERIAGIADPAARARAATEALAEHQQAVTRLARIRRAAVAELRSAGLSLAQVGSRLGVTRGRVAQLGVDYGVERQFFGGQDVTIVIPLRSTRLPDERLVIAQEDQQTANVLAHLCERIDLGVDRGYVAPDGEVDFSPEALVLVCGPKSSPVVNRLLATTEPAFEFSQDQAGRWRFVDKLTGAALVSPMDREPAEQGDYAYLGRLEAPGGRTFLLIAGVHAVGSLGVAHYLSEEGNLAWLYEQVGLDRFSMVIGSTFAGSPRQITSSQAITPPRRH